MTPPYRLDDPSGLLSPSLLIFRDLLVANITTMIAQAGSAERLRPHVKTHKMPAIVGLLESMGIRKHKCAIIAEAEMVAEAGGRDVLLAYPLVGPNVARLMTLRDRFPEVTFRVVVDSREGVEELARAVGLAGQGPLDVLIDLDVGMGRTGIAPADADGLARRIAGLSDLQLGGLHAYDGHIRDLDPSDRSASARGGIEATFALADRLASEGISVPRLVMGGTPTFPIHARLERPGVECSPGTSVLHDHSYDSKFPDLPYVPAAAILTRVISRPGLGRICLDVGTKAVAADPADDRIRLLDLPDASLGKQSEEHLVVETEHAPGLPPGTPLLAIPTHICPTCALHAFALVVEEGRVTDRWEVRARDRQLRI
jgi:D-serine deaminase-like pyridoxal phosphate-dependent protein